MTDHLTVAFIVGIAVIITIYDVWTLWRRGYTTTISWNLLLIGRRFPIIPFIFGVLVGHVLWSNAAAVVEAP